MDINLDWEFHGEQYEAFLSQAKRVIVRAGRRGGKGVLGARWAWRNATENPGQRDPATGEWRERLVTLVTATTYKQLEAYNLTALKKQMPPGFAVYKEVKNKFDCKNGHEVVLRSVDNYEALRGGGEFITGIWADEFGSYPPVVWDEILSFMLMDHDAPALITGTPKGMNKFYELYLRARDGKPGYETYHWTSWDNPFLSEEGKQEILELPANIQKQEAMAEFLDDLGGVFHGVRDCIAGVKEEPITAESYVMGADVGEVNDFNVATVMKRSTRSVVWWERFTGVEPDTVAERFNELSQRYNGAVVLIDDTGLGWGVARDTEKLGAPVKRYRFTPESKRQLIVNLVMAISSRSINIPEEYTELINELNIYQAEQLPSGTIRYGAPSGYHDDCVISGALACWGLSGIQITDFAPVMGRERMTLPAGPF